MGKTKYYLKLTIAYISRFKGVIFLGVLIGAAMFLIITFIYPHFYYKQEKIGITGRYRTEDLPDYILDMIGDGLTRINESGSPEPSIAYSWETNDKGKTWIFHLRDDIFWQDKEAVKAEDINYEYSDVEVEKPDEKTIIFKLKESFAPFPSLLSQPVFKKGLLGTGEWRVEKISLVASFVEQLILVKGKEKKIFKFYPTLERTKLAFKLGEVDEIKDVLEKNPFSSWNTVEIQEYVNKNQVVVLFFNTQDKLLSEKSFRQALTYAIDKEALGYRALSPISSNSYAFNPQVKPYNYDRRRSLELIKELSKEQEGNLEVKLVTTPVLLETAEKIAKDWQELGIKTTVQVYSIIPSEYQAYLTILDIPSDPDQYPLWHSTQTSTNISKYQNPRIDKLLEDGRIELSSEERRKIYLDFQRFLLEDLPAAFLYHPTYYTISRK